MDKPYVGSCSNKDSSNVYVGSCSNKDSSNVYVGSCSNKDSSHVYVEDVPFNICLRNETSSEPGISSVKSHFNLYKDTVEDMEDICDLIRNLSTALNNSTLERFEEVTTECTAFELKKLIDDQQMKSSDDQITNDKENSSINTDIDTNLPNISSVCEKNGGTLFHEIPISELKGDDNGKIVSTFSSTVTESTCKSFIKSECNISNNITHPVPSPESCTLSNCPGSSSVLQSSVSCLDETPFGNLNETSRFADLCGVNQYFNEDSKNIPSETSDIPSTTNNELDVSIIGRMHKMSVSVDDKLPNNDHVTANFVDASECDTTDVSINETTSGISDTEPSSGIAFPKHDCDSETSSSLAYDEYLCDSPISKLLTLSSSINSVTPLLSEDPEMESENSGEISLLDESSMDDSFSDEQRKYGSSSSWLCANCKHLLDTSSEEYEQEEEFEGSSITWDESRSLGTSENISSGTSYDEDPEEWSSSSSNQSSESISDSYSSDD